MQPDQKAKETGESEKTVDMLGFLLKYNAEVYDDLKDNGGFREKDPFHKPDVTTIDLPEEEGSVFCGGW